MSEWKKLSVDSPVKFRKLDYPYACDLCGKRQAKGDPALDVEIIPDPESCEVDTAITICIKCLTTMREVAGLG